MSSSTSAPPSYDAATSNGAGPSSSSRHTTISQDEKQRTEGNKVYRIGRHDLPSLVSLEELKAHLRLLEAFQALLQSVVSPSVEPLDDAMPDSGGLRWSNFVRRAVHRFEYWWHGLERSLRDERGQGKKAVVRGFREELLPPLDVLMIWHTYCLNPLAYQIDLRLNHAISSLIPSFPLLLAASQIDPSSHTFALTPLQAAAFRTLSSFDPAIHYTTSAFDTITVPCPLCFWSIEVVLGEGREGGGGWRNPEHRTMCGGCMKGTTAYERCVLKFVKDLRWAQVNNSLFPSFLLDPLTGLPNDPSPSSPISKLNAALLRVFLPLYPIGSKPFITGGMAGIQTVFAQNVADGSIPPGKGLDIVMEGLWARYAFPEPFGVNLVKAVTRQSSFTQHMFDLGWTHPDRFSKSPLPLQQSIGRYHAFLNLAVSSRHRLLYPTLDIDLAWQTHLLKTAQYRLTGSSHDSIHLLGKLLDHPFTVEPAILKPAYIFTAQAWSDHFGHPYSTCGCCLPVLLPTSSSSSSTPTPTPAKLFSQLKLKAKGKARSSSNSQHATDAAVPCSMKAAAEWTSGGDDPERDGSHLSTYRTVTLGGGQGTSVRAGERGKPRAPF